MWTKKHMLTVQGRAGCAAKHFEVEIFLHSIFPAQASVPGCHLIEGTRQIR
jgi:hypothetical protein